MQAELPRPFSLQVNIVDRIGGILYVNLALTESYHLRFCGRNSRERETTGVRGEARIGSKLLQVIINLRQGL